MTEKEFKKITNKASYCGKRYIETMDLFTEIFDNPETTRQEKLDMLDELGWVVGELMTLGQSACELLNTEMEFKDMIR